MLLDQRQARWAVGSAVAAVGSLAVFIVYGMMSPNGARGGSMMGLFFASAGTGIIVFECLLGLRKKYPASPLARVKTWLSAHVWLGLLSFLVIVVSGVFGVALQNYIPRRMTELVERETIYEQIPTVIRRLRIEADERVEYITADLGMDEMEIEFQPAGGVKYYTDPAQKAGAAEKAQVFVDKRKASPQIEVGEGAREALRAHYLQEIRPYLMVDAAAESRDLFGARELVAAYFNHLRTIMPVAAHDVLRDLEGICEERRQLLVQRRLHLWMHGWLLVHVPLSFALLVLTAVHAVLSLRY